MDEAFFPSPFHLSLVTEPIHTERLIRFVTSPRAGAVVLFLGTVREVTGDRVTASLDYEAYPPMALAQMEELAEEARSRWPIERIAMEHRLGSLQLTECSVAIAVSSPHRKQAFEAGQFLIDELKTRVPVWKKEHWADGTSAWVHPGLPENLHAETRQTE